MLFSYNSVKEKREREKDKNNDSHISPAKSPIVYKLKVLLNRKWNKQKKTTEKCKQVYWEYQQKITRLDFVSGVVYRQKKTRRKKHVSMF